MRYRVTQNDLPHNYQEFIKVWDGEIGEVFRTFLKLLKHHNHQKIHGMIAQSIKPTDADLQEIITSNELLSDFIHSNGDKIIKRMQALINVNKKTEETYDG